MRVCIEARLVSGHWGDMAQFVIGLAYGLSQIQTADRFDVMGHEGTSYWLKPYLNGPWPLVDSSMPWLLGDAAEHLTSIRLLICIWHQSSYSQVGRALQSRKCPGFQAVFNAITKKGGSDAEFHYRCRRLCTRSRLPH